MTSRSKKLFSSLVVIINYDHLLNVKRDETSFRVLAIVIFYSPLLITGIWVLLVAQLVKRVHYLKLIPAEIFSCFVSWLMAKAISVVLEVNSWVKWAAQQSPWGIANIIDKTRPILLI